MCNTTGTALTTDVSNYYLGKLTAVKTLIATKCNVPSPPISITPVNDLVIHPINTLTSPPVSAGGGFAGGGGGTTASKQFNWWLLVLGAGVVLALFGGKKPAVAIPNA